MQHPGALAQGDGRVGGEDALVPCAVLVMGHISFVRLYVAEANIGPIQIFLFHDIILHSAAGCGNLREAHCRKPGISCRRTSEMSADSLFWLYYITFPAFLQDRKGRFKGIFMISSKEKSQVILYEKGRIKCQNVKNRFTKPIF